jgi:hypothetical protein
MYYITFGLRFQTIAVSLKFQCSDPTNLFGYFLSMKHHVFHIYFVIVLEEEEEEGEEEAAAAEEALVVFYLSFMYFPNQVDNHIFFPILGQTPKIVLLLVYPCKYSHHCRL